MYVEPSRSNERRSRREIPRRDSGVPRSRTYQSAIAVPTELVTRTNRPIGGIAAWRREPGDLGPHPSAEVIEAAPPTQLVGHDDPRRRVAERADREIGGREVGSVGGDAGHAIGHLLGSRHRSGHRNGRSLRFRALAIGRR